MNPEKNHGNNREKPNRKSSLRAYLPAALVVLLVIIVSIIVFFLIFRYKGTGSGLKSVITALQSVIIGFVIAYLINPIMMFFDRRFLARAQSRGKEINARTRKRIRAGAVAMAMLIFLGIIAALVIILVPQIVSGIADFVGNFNANVSSATKWMEQLEKSRPELASQIQNIYDQATGYLRKWLQEKVLSNSNLIEKITSSIYTIVRTAFNTLMGLIVAIYILMKKETFKAETKKLIYAVCRPRIGNYVMEVLRKTDDVFGGFFIGDILDSLIIGILCFLGMLILQMPYAAMIALFVGVTNLIPVFGPYFGAIPSAILIVMVDPWKALIFLAFIVVLQQFDGNILKPKVLGDTLGLNPFWIIFSIVLFGGLWGIPGFFLGVPMFAVIYYVIKRIVERLLRSQHLPEDTRSYQTLDHINPKSRQVVLHGDDVDETAFHLAAGMSSMRWGKKAEKRQQKQVQCPEQEERQPEQEEQPKQEEKKDRP